MSQQHESGVVQSNVNPVLQPKHDNVPSGILEEPALSQPQIEDNGCCPGGISEEPQLSHPQIEDNECCPGGISEEPQLSQPQIEINECCPGGISEEPQLSQPQIEDNECWTGGISEEPQLSQPQIEDNECCPNGTSEEPQLSQPQIEDNECCPSGTSEEPQLSQPQIEVNECSPSGISEEPQLSQPQIEDNECCLSDTSEEPHLSKPQIEVNECSPSGISEEPQLSQHHIEDNECCLSDTSEEPQLSQPQIEIIECSPSSISEEPQLSQPQIEDDEFSDYKGTRRSFFSYRPLFNATQKGDWKSVKSFFNNKKKGLVDYERIGGSFCPYRPLFNAAQKGDWKSAKSFFDEDPNALTIGITCLSQTALHVAAISCKWGFILKLLEPLSRESIAVKDRFGNTILHYVAAGGSLKTAKALVQKNPDLPQMKDKNGHLPLITSIWSESSKELAWYLSLITEVDLPLLPEILQSLIQSGYHDIALHYVKKYPNLALGDSLLFWLAENPSNFFSTSNLGFLERWIYKFVNVEILNAPTHLVMVNIKESTESETALQSTSFETRVFRWFKRLLWKANIAKMAPLVQKVRDAKLKHKCAVKLIIHVLTQLSECEFMGTWHLQHDNSILGIAVKGGIEEIVRTLLQHFPDLIYCDALHERNILQAAVEYRQEKIVKIIKEISPTIVKALCANRKESDKTTLLMAGELAPSFKLFSVSGSALQMQRELQWFKEVENITFPNQRERKYTNNETAKDVFRKKHKKLAEQGEKWMKDTAKSCMLVSTLIATVLFAAAFTIPGGNINDKGIPIFLHTDAFTLFAISDTLGLFSSLTSLLMFLAIITSRYEVDDFLESLPNKLIIGLGSLFFAIAAMIIAFGAALTIILSERWHWVYVPVTILAYFPMAIYVMLQLPLFVQMVQSTYGCSIFRPDRHGFK